MPAFSMLITHLLEIDDLENKVEQLTMENVRLKEAKKRNNHKKGKLCNHT